MQMNVNNVTPQNLVAYWALISFQKFSYIVIYRDNSTPGRVVIGPDSRTELIPMFITVFFFKLSEKTYLH